MGTIHPSRAAVATASMPAHGPKRAEAVLAEVESIALPPHTVTTRIGQAFDSANPDGQCRADDVTLVVQLLRAIGTPADGRLDPDSVIEHSLAAAHAAAALAEQVGIPQRQAFFAAAFHDMGKLAMNARLPKAYSRVIERTIAEHRQLCDLESDMLGADHTRVGRRLAARWKLPRPVQDCAWLHHHPQNQVECLTETPALVAVVHVADAIARRLRPASPGINVESEPESMQRLGISDSTVRSIESAVKDRLEGPTVTGADSNEDRRQIPRLGQVLRAILKRVDADALPAEFASRIAEAACQLRRQGHAAVLITNDAGSRIEVGIFANGRRLVHQVTASKTQRFDWESLAESDSWVAMPAHLRQIAYDLECQLDGVLDEVLALRHGKRITGLLMAERQPKDAPSHTRWPTFARTCGALLAAAIDRREVAALSEELASLRRRVTPGDYPRATASAASHIARMAAGAAHELNNPLAVISARAQMLLDADVDERTLSSLKAIRDQASRASEIVTELLRLSRPRAAAPQPLLLGEWANRIRQYWQGRFNIDPDDITIRVVDADARMFADIDQLNEAATEIAANSLASAGSENLRLLINSESRATDETLVVSIGDNGAGMTPEVLRHALDPFYSERPAGRGRGLGLCKAAALIEANGGRIWIESAEGRGTTVFLALPAQPSN